MKLELIPSDYYDKNCKCLPQGSLVRCYNKLCRQKYNFWDQKLPCFWNNSHFFMIFRRNPPFMIFRRNTVFSTNCTNTDFCDDIHQAKFLSILIELFSIYYHGKCRKSVLHRNAMNILVRKSFRCIIYALIRKWLRATYRLIISVKQLLVVEE